MMNVKVDETTPPDAAQLIEADLVDEDMAVDESESATQTQTELGAAEVEWLPVSEEQLRMVEALLFAAAEPLDEASISARLPEGANIKALITELQTHYKSRGINLVCVAKKWAFRTAHDLGYLMEREAVQRRRLSRAALETLAIIAYHQPITRAEIEEVRGVVSVSKGTIDVLFETGWIKIKGRRKTPGRPVTYGVSDDFLSHFSLESVDDLPGIQELKAAGLLDSTVPVMPPALVENEDDEEEPDELELEEELMLEPEQAELEQAEPEQALAVIDSAIECGSAAAEVDDEPEAAAEAAADAESENIVAAYRH